jgi:hypothetical protein
MRCQMGLLAPVTPSTGRRGLGLINKGRELQEAVAWHSSASTDGSLSVKSSRLARLARGRGGHSLENFQQRVFVQRECVPLPR